MIEEKLRENARLLEAANLKKNKFYQKRGLEIKKSEQENSIESEQ